MRASNLPDIKALLEKKNWHTLRQTLTEWPIPETVDLLMTLDKPDRVLLFRLLPRHISNEVFSYLETEHQKALLKELTDDETKLILANLRPDDRTTLFEELPGQATQRLLNLLSPEDLKEARQLLGYPEESVGRLMTPDYVAVRPEWTVEQALKQVRKRGKDSETIDVIYVVDRKWKLEAILELRRLILAHPEQTVEEIMDQTFVSLSAFEDREQAVHQMQRYDLFALPVVDSDGVLLGIVTADDVMDVAQEEATEDFHKTAAVTPLRVSYREASIGSLYTKRVAWLVALVLVNLISSGIIATYEKTLASAIALTFFIPLLTGSGGNTGSQSATLMVRALATGDVKPDQWFRMLTKELVVGAFLGITMGLASSILGLWRGGPYIGMIVGLSMVFIVMVANIIGVSLPFFLSRLEVDPAVASSPLISTVADATGLLIYFTVANLFLRIVPI
jgi:magnesium transporter